VLCSLFVSLRISLHPKGILNLMSATLHNSVIYQDGTKLQDLLYPSEALKHDLHLHTPLLDISIRLLEKCVPNEMRIFVDMLYHSSNSTMPSFSSTQLMNFFTFSSSRHQNLGQFSNLHACQLVSIVSEFVLFVDLMQTWINSLKCFEE
jgi:hypothetical protein